MLHSGEVLSHDTISVPKVDKHSTGGVGDKTSLVIAPAAAACGLAVPMISGRALAHTGGTLDKLEAIPGFRTNLNLAEFRAVLAECGLALIGQTKEIAPADRKLYALRDLTGTVPFRPFITASIMSKKLAEGIDGLVLDVKTGNGAFMREYNDAVKLARMLAAVGRRMGKRVIALITDMNQPLGRWVGNAVETYEAIECLRGNLQGDFAELCLALTAQMILAGGVETDLETARAPSPASDHIRRSARTLPPLHRSARRRRACARRSKAFAASAPRRHYHCPARRLRYWHRDRRDRPHRNGLGRWPPSARRQNRYGRWPQPDRQTRRPRRRRRPTCNDLLQRRSKI